MGRAFTKSTVSAGAECPEGIGWLSRPSGSLGYRIKRATRDAADLIIDIDGTDEAIVLKGFAERPDELTLITAFANAGLPVLPFLDNRDDWFDVVRCLLIAAFWFGKTSKRNMATCLST